MKRDSLYRAFRSEFGGRPVPNGLFVYYNGAKRACSGSLEPELIDVLIMPDECRAVPSSCVEPIYISMEDKERRDALDKLTDREKYVLGLNKE